MSKNEEGGAAAPRKSRSLGTWTPADPERFDASYYAGAKTDKLARRFNSTRDRVDKYIRRRVLEGTLKRRGSFTPTNGGHGDDIDDLAKKVLGKVKKSKEAVSVIDLSNEFNVAPKRIEEVINFLTGENYLVNFEFGHLKFSAPKVGLRSLRHVEYLDGTRTFKFGIASDAHLGSRYSRLDHLNTLFDIFEQEKVPVVYDCGNQIDGEATFNKQDLLVHGLDNQVAFWAQNWPRREGIETRFICGDDHEGWYVQRTGLNIGRYMQMLAEREYGRTDLKYLGYMEHDEVYVTPEGGRTVVRVQHPGGGTAYAVSYQPQKIVESLSGGEKPHILLLGHYHKSGSFFVRSVHTLLVGCVCDQTPFMRKKRLAAHVGGYICEVTQAPDGSVLRWTPTFIPFYADHQESDQWIYKMEGYGSIPMEAVA